MRQVGRAAHHLIAVTRIDAQVDGRLDGLIELGGRQFLHARKRRIRLQQRLDIYAFCNRQKALAVLGAVVLRLDAARR